MCTFRVSTRCLALVMILGLAVVLPSCSDGPTSPDRPLPNAENRIVGLELSVPPEIAPDATVQLTVKAIKADRSVEDVTTQSQWIVTNGRTPSPSAPAILVVDSAGRARALDRGEVFVSARFAGLEASAHALILPPGTFRFSMTIQDGYLGLAGVAISITEGVGEGLRALTNDDGSFHVFGVSGAFRWRATKQGYVDLIRQETLAEHSRFDGLLQMTPSRARDNFAGSYTLTLSTQCALSPELFPTAARQRTYTARVVQSDSYLTVNLTGADFVLHRDSFTGIENGAGDSFSGQISSTGEVVFFISYYHGSYAVAERLGSAVLLIDGRGNAVASGDRIFGTMVGSIGLSSTPGYPFGLVVAKCATDRFEMVRR